MISVAKQPKSVSIGANPLLSVFHGQSAEYVDVFIALGGAEPAKVSVYAGACSISALATIRAMLMVFMSRGCMPIKRGFPQPKRHQDHMNRITTQSHRYFSRGLSFTDPGSATGTVQIITIRRHSHERGMTMLGHCFFRGDSLR